jgi:hypothetical protein
MSESAYHADSNDACWLGVPYRFMAEDDIKQENSEKMVALRMFFPGTCPWI